MINNTAMTEAEAIVILERIAHTESKWPGTEDSLKALDMAIAALRRATPANDPLTPCLACGYGGKHLDAPPCDTCPAWPKHPPKSAPITLEELREMDGEPVWVQEITPAPIDGDYWGVVDVDFLCENRYAAIGAIISPATNGVSRFGLTPFSEYGKTWLAYRRKPEGSDKEC